MTNRCVSCDREFTTRSNLLRHIREVHQKARIIVNCDHCQKTFSNKRTLTRHLKSCRHAFLKSPTPSASSYFTNPMFDLTFNPQHPQQFNQLLRQQAEQQLWQQQLQMWQQQQHTSPSQAPSTQVQEQQQQQHSSASQQQGNQQQQQHQNWQPLDDVDLDLILAGDETALTGEKMRKKRIVFEFLSTHRF